MPTKSFLVLYLMELKARHNKTLPSASAGIDSHPVASFSLALLSPLVTGAIHPSIHPLQPVLLSLELTRVALRTSTRAVFSRKADACLCFDLSRSFGLSRNKHLISLDSLLRDSLRVRSLDRGNLRTSLQGFCLLPLPLGERHQQSEPRLFILHFQTKTGHF